jgi:hypothetical protein
MAHWNPRKGELPEASVGRSNKDKTGGSPAAIRLRVNLFFQFDYFSWNDITQPITPECEYKLFVQ